MKQRLAYGKRPRSLGHLDQPLRSLGLPPSANTSEYVIMPDPLALSLNLSAKACSITWNNSSVGQDMRRESCLNWTEGDSGRTNGSIIGRCPDEEDEKIVQYIRRNPEKANLVGRLSGLAVWPVAKSRHAARGMKVRLGSPDLRLDGAHP